MIEEAPIVKDTRKVRYSISEKFNDDLDQYVDYLLRKSTTFLKKEIEINKRNKLQHQTVF